MEEKNTKKRHSWIWIVAIAVLAVAAAAGLYYWVVYTTYSQIEIVETYENDSSDNGSYLQYIDGVLEYSRDGIAFLTKEGEEIWNQPCQMSNPIVEICKETAAVADKGGTSIYVFQKKGLKGEIQTTTPIEKISVSEQGIVAAILKDEEVPKVMCYDADGNTLIEHKASFNNTGYPVDIALSQDGNTLLVSYVGAKGSSVLAKVAYYYFGEDSSQQEDYQVADMEYVDTIIPTTAFVDKNTSILVADNALIFMEGLKEPQEKFTITLEKEIKSVAYNEKYVALVLKNSGQTDFELCLYRMDGKQVLSIPFEGEYNHIKVVDDQILLYDGNKCVVYNDSGVCKFEGIFEMNIMDMFPVSGFNKYIVISANGFQEIQFVK